VRADRAEPTGCPGGRGARERRGRCGQGLLDDGVGLPPLWQGKKYAGPGAYGARTKKRSAFWLGATASAAGGYRETTGAGTGDSRERTGEGSGGGVKTKKPSTGRENGPEI